MGPFDAGASRMKEDNRGPRIGLVACGGAGSCLLAVGAMQWSRGVDGDFLATHLMNFADSTLTVGPILRIIRLGQVRCRRGAGQFACRALRWTLDAAHGWAYLSAG